MNPQKGEFSFLIEFPIILCIHNKHIFNSLGRSGMSSFPVFLLTWVVFFLIKHCYSLLEDRCVYLECIPFNEIIKKWLHCFPYLISKSVCSVYWWWVKRLTIAQVSNIWILFKPSPPIFSFHCYCFHATSKNLNSLSLSCLTASYAHSAPRDSQHGKASVLPPVHHWINKAGKEMVPVWPFLLLLDPEKNHLPYIAVCIGRCWILPHGG